MEVRIASGAVVVEIGAALGRADVAGLCDRADECLGRVPEARLVCAVQPGRRVDLVLVDILARLRLLARRRGRAYQVRDAPAALRDLVGLVGLRDALPIGDAHAPPPPRPGPRPRPVDSGLEFAWKAEEREQVFGVEEGVEADDPPL
ncbi:STAS domain-containing protein [Yinghuangia sp. ASG 101]|uniref:STAS domain-containing protein n=1 Tax=Yinghuangia sp. ASG 101 TaxID=2896848 RepID=UPI001E5D1336|nr:STAS domain-containing protein [Yinghuangia sp. ASG 101]UGQ13652.1 STAS domain-containing protein [Yinghuangia sp. ASG 101]